MCSVVGNNAGKSVLAQVPLPMTLCIIQYTLATIFVSLSKFTFEGKSPILIWSLLQRAKWVGILLGFLGIISNVSHRVALMFIPVSFAHTVKATQPLFSAILSFAFLGQTFTMKTCVSLFTVAAGVALAALTEFQFNIIGFIAAGTSAIAMSVANVSMKCVLQLSRNDVILPTIKTHIRNFDKNDMFLIINAYSLALAIPIWCFIELPSIGLTSFTPSRTLLILLNTGTMVVQHFLALSILARCSPVTHSIVNSCKRVVVISFSVLYFGNPVSALNAMGIFVTLGGIVLYERSLRERPNSFSHTSEKMTHDYADEDRQANEICVYATQTEQRI